MTVMKEENEHVLFEIQSTITRRSTQSHIKHTFFVPEQTHTVYIDFSFDPPHMIDLVENERIIQEAHDFYGVTHSRSKKVEPVRNLLTLSVDDPEGFRGSRHYHSPVQQMAIRPSGSTPGVLNKANRAGLWSVTVSIHALVTEACQFTVRVYSLAAEGKANATRSIPWQSKLSTTSIDENKEKLPVIEQESEPTYWLPAELHTHTFHSDGKQSVLEMAVEAKNMGLQALVVSDHNTTSPLQDIEEARRESGLHILYGLEWTTFYGHLLTIGYEKLTYTDWRDIGPYDMEKGIATIHKHGALAGMAHPFRIGNPIGTGCHWEFPVKNINIFDFIEVWNSVRPGAKMYNQRAFAYWTDILNKGYRLTATAGRDWHHNEEKDPLPAITYVRMPESWSPANKSQVKTEANEGTKLADQFRRSFLAAIRSGKVSISYGSPLELHIYQAGIIYEIGDSICREKGNIQAHIQCAEWPRSERIDSKTFQLRLVSNIGQLVEGAASHLDMQFSIDDVEKLSWIRAELYGLVDHNDIPELIAFTNPIYFE